jgi:NitT/TauT family transport system substrate-binding protein
MHPSTRRLVAVLGTLFLAGCTSGTAVPYLTPSSTSSTTPTGSAARPLTPLVVGLGYIPSVQFAQFYYAEEHGYYQAAGLDVTFQNKNDPDLVTLVGQGAIDVGVADGTSVIPAVSQGIPITYVATIYGLFPNVVFAKTGANITSVAALKGKKVGTPGRYGSSWIMLEALLASGNLSVNDSKSVLYRDDIGS